MTGAFDLRGFVNAWNTQSIDRILEFYAEDAEMIVPPDTEPYRGKEGIRRNFEDVTGGLDDMNGDVAWSIQDGNRVSLLVHLSGRHTGEMVVSDELKVPATQRDVRVMMGMFLELDDKGKIKREIDLVDNLGILQQVGAMERMMSGERKQEPLRSR